MALNVSGHVPIELIEELGRLRDELRQLEDRVEQYRRLKEKDETVPVDFLQEQLKECKEKMALLHRLIARSDMEAGWRQLNKPAAPAPHWKSNWSLILWNHIVFSLKDFDHLISDKRTPTVKRNDLTKLAKKVDEVVELIGANTDIHNLAFEFLQKYVALKNLAYRIHEGEKIPEGELRMPSLVISSDCDDARKAITAIEKEDPNWDDENAITEIEYSADGQYVGWHNVPLIWRLRYWAESIQQTPICDLLRSFSDELKTKASEKPEIFKPALGEAAKKGFLIRRISAHMQWYYGQPFDEIVARIVTVILELPEPGLTREYVRSYLSEK